MNMFSAIKKLAIYLFDAIGQIFSSHENPVPSIGVQPFNGDALSEWREF